MAEPLGFGLVNVSKSITDNQMAAMAAALQIQLQRDASFLWNFSGAMQVKVFDALSGTPANWWKMMFTDTATEPDDYGYHTDLAGNVYSEIEISVIVAGGGKVLDGSSMASVSTVASHEMLETVADPQANLWTPYPNQAKPSFVATEVCDPVQGSSYVIPVVMGGSSQEVWVSDFVTPYWFDPNPPAGSKFDFMNVVNKPFLLGPGGYAVLKDEAGNSSDIWGDRKPPEWRLKIGNRRKDRHRKVKASVKV